MPNGIWLERLQNKAGTRRRALEAPFDAPIAGGAIGTIPDFFHRARSGAHSRSAFGVIRGSYLVRGSGVTGPP